MSVGPGRSAETGLLADTTRANLLAAWAERVEEAEVLLAAGHRSMGLALKTYALEARIKLRICDHLGLELLPKACKTHELSELLIFTGLWAELRDPANDLVFRSWDAVADFSRLSLNRLRYEPRVAVPDAIIDKCLDAFDDPTRGVFAWLARSR